MHVDILENKMGDMVKILVDEPVEHGVLGFEIYSKALTDIIIGSDPRFVIGLFGGWGVGKTTLMTMVYKSLEDKDGVVPVWFNAWRYERKKYSVVIPLLNTILVSISERPELNDLKETLTRIVRTLAMGLKFPLIPTYGGIELDVDQMLKATSDLKKITNSDAIYYDELKYIMEALKKINDKRTKQLGKSEMKFVVFIDDLDRCAPDRIVEVLESIKIFLGMGGFIYVLGLSAQVVEKCIELRYRDLGISGSDYLGKIVQISFRLPEWDEPDIKAYRKYVVEKLDDNYKRIFDDYEDLVIKGLEKNPRTVKKFINNYIATKEVFSSLDEGIVMILQIFQFNWPDLYKRIFDFDDFREALYKRSAKDSEISPIHMKYLEEIKNKEILDAFLQSVKAKDVLEKLKNEKDLNQYRRAGKLLPQESRKPQLSSAYGSLPQKTRT